MNVRQLWYQLGRFFSGNGDLSYSAIAAFMGCSMAKTIALGTISPPAAAFQALLLAYTSRISYYGIKGRLRLRGIKKELDSQPGEYYFAESEKIVISHRQGLEMLLEKTAEKRWKEWGTVLNAHEEGSRAVVHNIIKPEKAEKSGIIKRKLMRVVPDAEKIMDFDGVQHYHPWGGSGNYSVSRLDRNLPEGWINLLTFNTGGRPEIIAYNIRYTYIPKDREDKSVLVKATPQQIMEYLI